MFGFGKKKTINIEEESAKIDSMINYLDLEINIIFEEVLNTSFTEADRIKILENREIAMKGYAESSMKLFALCNKELRIKFMSFFNKKASNFQNKMHTMVGSSIILLYLRSGATENIQIFEEHIIQLLDELSVVYDNQ